MRGFVAAFVVRAWGPCTDGPYRVTTDSQHLHPVAPNRLERRFDGWERSGPAQLDRLPGFLSEVPAGQAAAASGGNEVK